MNDSLVKTGLGKEIRYSYSGKQLFYIWLDLHYEAEVPNLSWN